MILNQVDPKEIDCARRETTLKYNYVKTSSRPWPYKSTDDWGTAAYQLRNTSSRIITEVKQREAQVTLGWEIVQVSSVCCC